MNNLSFYLGAALAEIGGCFAFWAWLRLDKSIYWLVPGVIALVTFALFLTRIETDFAGRAYAAYGGVYIASSLLWMWPLKACTQTAGMRSVHPSACLVRPLFSGDREQAELDT